MTIRPRMRASAVAISSASARAEYLVGLATDRVQQADADHRAALRRGRDRCGARARASAGRSAEAGAQGSEPFVERRVDARRDRRRFAGVARVCAAFSTSTPTAPGRSVTRSPDDPEQVGIAQRFAQALAQSVQRVAQPGERLGGVVTAP